MIHTILKGRATEWTKEKKWWCECDEAIEKEKKKQKWKELDMSRMMRRRKK